jgi:phasin family protein
MAEQQSNSPWPDLGELLKQFQIPGLDLGKWADSQRQNIKALQEANQAAVQGWQNLMTRQAEQLRESFEAWQQAIGESAKGDPGEVAKRQLEMGQQAFEKALANMRELADIAVKAQSDASDIIRKRFEESLKELQKS